GQRLIISPLGPSAPASYWAEGVTWLWREPSTPRVQTFGPAGPTLGMRRAGTVTLTVEELKG
ncbi:MAG TPA: hypothetical protein VMT27_08440, partial [Actinomycetes bacterium]|nr:hypothetical protein [Actinomycetes bacterium]